MSTLSGDDAILINQSEVKTTSEPTRLVKIACKTHQHSNCILET